MVECLRYFTHDELVPPDIAKKGASYCFGLFYEHVLLGLDQLRHDLGFPLYVNDWAIGGMRKYSGYRPRTCTIGAANSMHKTGGAFDLHTRTEDERNKLIARIKGFPNLYGFRRMENPKDTPTWVHVDSKEHGRPLIHVFNP